MDPVAALRTGWLSQPDTSWPQLIMLGLSCTGLRTDSAPGIIVTTGLLPFFVYCVPTCWLIFVLSLQPAGIDRIQMFLLVIAWSCALLSPLDFLIVRCVTAGYALVPSASAAGRVVNCALLNPLPAACRRHFSFTRHRLACCTLRSGFWQASYLGAVGVAVEEDAYQVGTGHHAYDVALFVADDYALDVMPLH